MTTDSKDLGIDIWGLWNAGRVSIPKVAAEYAAANTLVAGTADYAAAAFLRPQEIDGSLHGSSYEAWQQLRDQLQVILGKTAEYLGDTATALCTAADEYARSDAAAKAEFEAMKQRRGDPPPPDISASKYPPVPPGNRATQWWEHLDQRST